MKRKNGFLLLESVISITIIVMLVSILYYLLFFCINIKVGIENKVELQQQAIELENYIQKIIGESKGILNTELSKNSTNLISVKSIKCKYRDELISDNTIKDKELSLKTNTNKLFINTLNKNGYSESGGYEIGDYIDNMYIALQEDGRIAKLKLELSKNNQKYSTEFDIYIRNIKEENI